MSSASNSTASTALARVSRVVRQLVPATAAAAAASDAGVALSPSLARHIRFSPEVAAALREGRPVVSLESTIISHGMPYPQNLECAQQVESMARANGATPATIAILGGVVCVGLDAGQMEVLARAGPACLKVSRRDLASAVASKSHGATTVAATMIVSAMVGISVFTTGGIGGVHRGAESSMDISADLAELGRTPVAVVCAGVKSLLDIPRTLEVLETNGVAVATVGSDEFPAFFTPRSGCVSPLRIESPTQGASMILAAQELGLQSGMVFAVPIPAEHAAAAEPTEAATQRALAEASEKGVKGRDITPFLLGRISELTGGESLKSNIALILNNVAFGAKMAVELAGMQRASKAASAAASSASSSSSAASSLASLRGPLVVGGSNQDILGRPAAGSKLLLGTSNPGTLSRCWGGVGRNVAEVMGRLDANPTLLTAVGSDEAGSNLSSHLAAAGVATGGVLSFAGATTSTYLAILDDRGDLFTTVADMAVTDRLAPEHLPSVGQLRQCPLMVLDGNVSQAVIDEACVRAKAAQVPVCFEPTSIEKCVRIVPALLANRVTFVTPSAAELMALAEAIPNQTAVPAPSRSEAERRDRYEHNHSTDAVTQHCTAILTAVFQRHSSPLQPVHILLKRGEQGVMLASLMPQRNSDRTASPRIDFLHLPIFPLERIVNTSGAGDTMVGATCAKLLQLGSEARFGRSVEAVAEAVAFGMRAAEMTLMAEESVSPLLSPAALQQRQEAFLRLQQTLKR